MTRRINLVADLLVATEPPPPAWAILAVVGGALVVPLLVWGVHVRAASQLDPQVVELRAARDRLAGEGDRTRMLITNLEAQNVRRTREQAQAEQINWREAFRELTLVVPNGMWLSEMGGQGAEAQPPGLPPQEGDIPIRIRGVAVSQGVVADLLVNLEMSSHFRDPTVIYTQRQGGQEVGRVGFEIQCGLRRAPIGGLAAGETA